MKPTTQPTNPRIVILDRDGVINYDSADYIKTADEWRPIPGSAQAIALLCESGFDVYVVTNQSGIGRGLFDERAYRAITEKMLATIDAAGGSLKAVFYCPHSPDDDCNCRKPKTGLLQQVSAVSGQSLEGVPAIGDSLRDLQAAHSAGCQPILVRTGNGSKTLSVLAEHAQLTEKTRIFDNLADAAATLIAERGRH